MTMTHGFEQGAQLVRRRQEGRVRELGEVKDCLPDGRVLVAIKRDGRDCGTETFNPAHDFGWRLCG